MMVYVLNTFQGMGEEVTKNSESNEKCLTLEIIILCVPLKPDPD